MLSSALLCFFVIKLYVEEHSFYMICKSLQFSTSSALKLLFKLEDQKQGKKYTFKYIFQNYDFFLKLLPTLDLRYHYK